MIRRLFKTGNSIVLSLPREILDDLKLSSGQDMSLEFDPHSRRIIITPLEKPLAIPGVDPEFAQQVDEFINQYRPALEKLAR